MPAKKIFVSYRRGDKDAAGLLRSEIARRVGSGRVFMDTRNLEAGEDFEESIVREISSSDVVLAVIGPSWQAQRDRLAAEDDWVRRELKTGLAEGARVVPVLVGNTDLPDESELPEDLSALATRQAYRIDDDHVDRDIDDLLRALGVRRRPNRALVGGAVIAVAVAVWALWPGSDEGISFLNTELIVDNSAEMAQNIPAEGGGDLSKAAAAELEVTQYVGLRDNDNLALRVAAGCDSAGELLVPFRKGAGAAITSALADTALSDGKFSLADAVVAATGDFNDPKRFPIDETNRQIIVFTSSGDTCKSDPAAVLAERWEEMGDIQLRVEFIGLNITDPEQERQLVSMSQAVDGRVFFVDSQDELDQVLAQLLDVEPVLEAVDAVIGIGNAIVAPLNTLSEALNSCDFMAAREASEDVDDAVRSAGPVLDSLEGRDDRESYQALHQAGTEWAEGLAEVFDSRTRPISLVESQVGNTPDDTKCAELRSSEDWGEAVDQFNEAVSGANARLRAVQEKRAELLAELD